MDSRELVRRTIEFDSPPGIPRQTWLLPWAEDHYPAESVRLTSEYPDDIVSAPALYTRSVPVEGERYRAGRYVDEWGCFFDNLQDGIIGVTREPLIASWDDLESFEPPAAVLDLDREAINAFCRESDRFVLAGTVVRPFERLCFLRTFEQALIDTFERPAGFTELLEVVHQFYLKEVEVWAQTEVDGIALMDDWGHQHGLMIAPDLWRELFKDLYREYAEIARSHGKYVFMHSDGWITDIIGDLAEVGIQALNSQVHCMDVTELGERYRGKITFWGEIDRQQLLPHGSLEDIRQAVAEIHENLYAGGGVIAQCEFGPAARPENVFEVFAAWDEIADTLQADTPRKEDRSAP